MHRRCLGQRFARQATPVAALAPCDRQTALCPRPVEKKGPIPPGHPWMLLWTRSALSYGTQWTGDSAAPRPRGTTAAPGLPDRVCPRSFPKREGRHDFGRAWPHADGGIRARRWGSCFHRSTPEKHRQSPTRQRRRCSGNSGSRTEAPAAYAAPPSAPSASHRGLPRLSRRFRMPDSWLHGEQNATRQEPVGVGAQRDHVPCPGLKPLEQARPIALSRRGWPPGSLATSQGGSAAASQ
mmetsp:Transcript_30855/g.71273  ORF Transcript_30855/g.71273 Transcript_30855/m.71273 type:complete len:238 (-) Transcript_30855:683-1396(-)